MARSSSQPNFDEHERPTAQRSRTVDPNATQKLRKSEIESLVRRESGARPVVTAEQIDAFMRDRTSDVTDAPAALDDPRDRETLDATTLPDPPRIVTARMPAIAPPAPPAPEPQQAPAPIPIHVDLSRVAPGRAQVSRTLLVVVACAVAVLSAAIGFLAGRASL